MSRVIVKNLPKNCTENKVRQHFRQFEPLTDVSLKFTKDGVFRKFAFIGFEKEASAQQAIDHFNQTYFGTSKIAIEPCLPIAEKDKVRPWMLTNDFMEMTQFSTKVQQQQNVLKTSVMNSKYASDPLFNEFLKVRGVESTNQENEGDEDSTKALLDALDGFKGEKELSLIFRGLPVNLKQTNLKEWLSPVRLKSCYLFRSSTETFAFVGFNRANDLKKALLRTDQFLGGYKVRICKFPSEPSTKKSAKDTKEHEDFDPEAERKKLEDDIMETGRLFLRNLPFVCTERDLMTHFKKFGEVVDCQCVVDRKTGQCKGFAVITFMFPEHALAAYKEFDGTIFKGRMLHILPGKEKPAESSDAVENQPGMSIFQKKREADRKGQANKSAYSWNTLFMGANAIAETAGTRMALAETRLVNETRAFLERNGVVLDAFSRPDVQRSDTVIIAKNLPAGIDDMELKQRFEKYGEIKRFLLPPECKVTALIEMKNRVDAKKAFTGLAYSRIHSQPLYLEWAPVDVFVEGFEPIKEEEPEETVADKVETEENEAEEKQEECSKILVRNIPFQATPKEVRAIFAAFGELKTVRLPKKAGGQEGHRGFGFIDFMSSTDARTAFDALSHSTHLYGRRLVLEWSKETEDVEEIRTKTKRKMNTMQRKSMSKRQIRDAIETRHKRVTKMKVVKKWMNKSMNNCYPVVQVLLK
ncbi:putative RNA-binding protein 19 [Aphelenchoides bicaudatus]|nr:putative RNA-binding protein 19 [Aphelenchoides bicaudatus]